VIFGAVIDDSMGDQVRVTVIATGFGGRLRRRRAETPIAVSASSSERPAFDAPSVRDVEIDIPSFLKEE
jgi:cell division protein FtsZ